MLIRKQKSPAAIKIISFILLYSFILTNVFSIKVFAETAKQTSVAYPTLTKYSTDLTELARNGRLNQNANYEREVNRLVTSLASGDARQPVVLDETGESQELVIEGVASRIASGNVPAALKGKRVFKLEIDNLFSNSKNNAESSEIVANIISELVGSKGEIILFVDELTNFVGNFQINDALKNALVQGKVKIIGGSSKIAYNERINPSAEIAALFNPLTIGEAFENLSDKDFLRKKQNERFKGDNVSPDIREMMAQDATGGKKKIEVIIQAKNADNPALRSLIEENNVRLNDRIGDSDTLVVKMSLNAVEQLSKSGLVNYMSPDREIKTLGHIENTSGAAAMRSQPALNNRPAYTLDGSGVNGFAGGSAIGIAVVDSGIMTAHKAFTEGSTTSRVVYSQNFVTTTTSTDDDYGHGTHVAAIAAGSASRDSNAYRGIAPKAKITNLKVLNAQGTGKTSYLLNALSWLITNSANTAYNIKVVNLSLGTPAIDSYLNDAVCQKVEQLNSKGILVVAAAGNNGKKSNGQKVYGQIHSPGNDPSVLTVGASNTMGTDSRSDDTIASYSSHGPTRSYYVQKNCLLILCTSSTKVYDNVIKPDIVAPGNKIISAKARSTSTLVTQNPNLTNTTLNITGDDNDLMYLSGTSMSTPMVSGAAVLLFQSNPRLTPTMVKMILEYSAQPINGYNMFEQGAGELNIDGAVKIANYIRQDVDFMSVSNGGSITATGAVFPSASSTISGTTFGWAQGILSDHAYIKGTKLVSSYQNVYDLYNWFEDGVLYDAFDNQTLDWQLYSSCLLYTSPSPRDRTRSRMPSSA